MKTRNFKSLLLLILMTVSAAQIAAQSSDIEIEFTASDELTINEFSIDNKASIEGLIKVLGEPSSIEEYPNGEKSYFYEDLGVVFGIKGEKVIGLGINYNWDGDKKFPETSYQGTLKLGELSTNKDTKSEAIATIASMGFTCPFPMMCASSDREADINCLVGFKDGLLTQVAFVLK